MTTPIWGDLSAADPGNMQVVHGIPEKNFRCRWLVALL